jgi:hypothetical protein
MKHQNQHKMLRGIGMVGTIMIEKKPRKNRMKRKS